MNNSASVLKCPINLYNDGLTDLVKNSSFMDGHLMTHGLGGIEAVEAARVDTVGSVCVDRYMYM